MCSFSRFLRIWRPSHTARHINRAADAFECSLHRHTERSRSHSRKGPRRAHWWRSGNEPLMLTLRRVIYICRKAFATILNGTMRAADMRLSIPKMDRALLDRAGARRGIDARDSTRVRSARLAGRSLGRARQETLQPEGSPVSLARILARFLGCLLPLGRRRSCRARIMPLHKWRLNAPDQPFS